MQSDTGSNDQATIRPTGMGATIHGNGVAFRVWAPHADQVFVIGTFNAWNETSHPMARDANGMWSADLVEAKAGDEYRYLIINGEVRLRRIDPHSRAVTNSVGNSIVFDVNFDWSEDHFQIAPWNELVIYELHIGTFNDVPGNSTGTFQTAMEKLPHLKKLGINAIEIMPAAEFAGDYSWGYNPAHIFAVEQSYGGPNAFKQFVKAAHQAGIAVILDVVYNHFGPSDLNIWQFDGWSENNLGGIYFYNDWRSETPWGNTRPDYGRGEVRQFIRDNAMMWLEEYHLDGLRLDMTLYVRTVRGANQGCDLPEGLSLAQWLNQQIHERFPAKITIAEDLQNDEEITRPVNAGGLGFGSQWCAEFVHPVRNALIVSDDSARSMDDLSQALRFAYNGDPFQRVIYTESHDEVANGKARVTSEVSPGDPQDFFAQKRSTLGAALVLTSPGIPMIFQGQEFLEGGWFRDTVPIEWNLDDKFHAIVRLYRDLIRLRRNVERHSRGLCGRGITVSHQSEDNDMLAYHRWDQHGPGDDVLVVVNLANRTREDYQLGFPTLGQWKLRFNSDWQGYSDVFQNTATSDANAEAVAYDGHPASAKITIGPYSVLIFSQDFATPAIVS